MVAARKWGVSAMALAGCLAFCLGAEARGAEAVVWVADDGGLGIEAAKSARRIAVAALNENGIATAEPQGADSLHELDDEAKRLATELRVEQTYVLRLSQLGEKVVVTATLYDEAFASVRSRQMTALSIEDLELVVPRLVLAVAQGTTTGNTAEVDTVTEREAEPWNKKHGELLFGLGILMAGGFHSDAAAQYGLDLKIAYEMKYFRVNLEIAGAAGIPDFDDALARGGIGLSYLILARDWSPYLGLSLSYMFAGVTGHYGAGLGVTPHLGVEGFRLHAVRFLFEFGVTFPVYELDGLYAPIGHGAVCILW